MTTALGAVALAGLAVTIASMVWLHLVPTGLSPLRNAVSQYGISVHRAGYRVATIAFGAAGAALAAGALEGPAFPGCRLVAGLLALFALARLLVSWAPMDEPGAPRTTSGSLHWVLAVAAFGAITAAAVRAGRGLPAQWATGAVWSQALGWVMLAGLLGQPLARPGGPLGGYFGAAERLFYLGAIAWSVLAAVGLLAGRF